MHPITVSNRSFLSIFLFIILTAIIITYFNNNDRGSIDYQHRYPEYVQRAEQLWLSLNKGNRNEMMSRRPIAIELSDKVCVALELEPGALGGIPAYCFLKKDKSLVDKYDMVE
jgi:hypothetical protein